MTSTDPGLRCEAPLILGFEIELFQRSMGLETRHKESRVVT